MKELQIVLSIIAIGLCLWLFSTLEPWIDETFGEKEKEEISIESDIKKCGKDQPPHRIGSTLYCTCSESESQRPGHCKEKYK